MAMDKRILPESFQYGIPSVEIVGAGSKGLDKQAMLKRASAFDDVLGDLKEQKGKTYLHVITTGAFEKYGCNLNGDAFNEDSFDLAYPHPEDPKHTHDVLDGGLLKYHDSSYMDKKAAVYQEHKTREEQPSGEIVAARYNKDMHRGELIIAVDNNKWARRLQKKASGQDIYLSMGCSVNLDRCLACGHIAKTASEHCDHFKKMRRQVLDDGTAIGVMNDAPHFYDISGVDVPADRIAFVLRKVASGDMAKEASAEALSMLGARRPMLFTKAAATLSKLSRMEKQLEGIVEGDKDAPEFDEDEDAQKRMVIILKRYPADEAVDATIRKGILLSPSSLFSLLGGELGEKDGRETLENLDDGCCGDCSRIMSEAEEDGAFNDELLDGSFDQVFPTDLSLDSLLEKLVPELGMSNPAVRSRSIHIIIRGKPNKGQDKKASLPREAEKALRQTYARYLISFASRNDDATCMNALRKVATYGR